MGTRESLSRSFMLICFGAAVLLLSIQWRMVSSASNPTSDTPNSTATKVQVAASLMTRQSSAAATSNLHLKVDLSDRRLDVYRAEKLEASYPIAVGQEGWETPTGSFNVIEMERNPIWEHPITGEEVPSGPDNPLGSRWIGFWADNRYYVGFHGTNQEDSIGHAVSHGCVRLRDQDIQKLYELVSIGTEVTVEP